MKAEHSDSARWLFGGLLAYFVLHVMLRVLVSGTVEFDEAEQVVLTQALRLGYSAQPPLYSWIQAGFFAVLGKNVFALSLLKNILLCVTYLITYVSSREITGDSRRATVATLLLLLVPQIAWESQRDLTHTVLVTALVALSFFLFLKMFTTGRMWYYLSFGIVAGLGMLSKYNFGIFLVSLCAAGATIGGVRSRLKPSGVALSALLMIATAALPYRWMLLYRETAFSGASKLHAGDGHGWIGGVVKGSLSLGGAIILFLAVAVPVFMLVFRSQIRRESVSAVPGVQLAWRTVGIGLGICVVMVLFFGVSHFKDRWMQPILYPVPLALAGVISADMTSRSFRMFTRLAVGAAVAILVALPAQTLLGGVLVKPNRLNTDFSKAAGIIRQGGFTQGVIAADTNYVGANLAFQFSGAIVNVPEVKPFSSSKTVPWLVVWRGKETEPPAKLQQMVEAVRGPLSPALNHASAAIPLLRLNYIVIPADPEPAPQLQRKEG